MVLKGVATVAVAAARGGGGFLRVLSAVDLRMLGTRRAVVGVEKREASDLRGVAPPGVTEELPVVVKVEKNPPPPPILDAVDEEVFGVTVDGATKVSFRSMGVTAPLAVAREVVVVTRGVVAAAVAEEGKVEGVLGEYDELPTTEKDRGAGEIEREGCWVKGIYGGVLPEKWHSNEKSE